LADVLGVREVAKHIVSFLARGPMWEAKVRVQLALGLSARSVLDEMPKLAGATVMRCRAKLDEMYEELMAGRRIMAELRLVLERQYQVVHAHLARAPDIRAQIQSLDATTRRLVTEVSVHVIQREVLQTLERLAATLESVPEADT
jgi:hypothetical protein